MADAKPCTVVEAVNELVFQGRLIFPDFAEDDLADAMIHAVLCAYGREDDMVWRVSPNLTP